MIWWLLCYILPFKGFKPFVTVGLVWGIRHVMLMIRSSWRHPRGVWNVETGGWKWVELGGRYTIVHTCRKTNGWNFTSKPPMLQLLKDWRNIMCELRKIKNPPCFSGSTCELSRVLPTCHHGKWTNSGLGLGFRPRPRPGPESGTEDPRGLFEEGERDAWAGNHSEPKLLKS